MSNISVSIIVPVYKAEAYLHRCVDSILAQTFTNWELLLIDDGSPDRSGAICDEYASKDARIRVFHKENGGVSSARQKGQDEAQGEYTIHADPDDWVEPTMLEELYKKAKADDADMVICDYYMNDGKNQTYITQKPSNLDSNTVLKELFQQLHGSCWNKLVRRVCYSGKADFPDGINCCEDLIWCVKVLKQNPRISYIHKAYYHYILSSSDSQSKTISAKRVKEDLSMLHTLESLLSSNQDVKNDMLKQIVPYVMKRAMKSHCFDAQYFKSNFKPYSKWILSSRTHSIPLRLICFLSANGLHDYCRPFISLMK